MKKVLIISSAIGGGGANIAAFRLYNSLKQEKNLKIKYLSVDNLKYKRINRLFIAGNNKLSSYLSKDKRYFSWSFLRLTGIKRSIKSFDPDILHLHWTSLGIIHNLNFLRKDVKVIITLHDMRAFTNGCHYAEQCENYINKCNPCKFNHLPQFIQSYLPKYLSVLHPIIYIAPSKWILACVERSSYFRKGYDSALCIPNVPKKIKQKKMNSTMNDAIISTGALNFDLDPRKGFKYLYKFIRTYDGPNINLIIYGLKNPKKVFMSLPKSKNIRFFCLGTLSESQVERLNQIVCGILFFSEYENLSNILVENIQHGNFSVAFDIGGNSDIISHKYNGYLSKPFDEKDMVSGLKYCLRIERSLMIKRNTSHFSDYFSEPIVIAKHKKIYETN